MANKVTRDICSICNGNGYIKSNTIEYEGDCPSLPHFIINRANGYSERESWHHKTPSRPASGQGNQNDKE